MTNADNVYSVQLILLCLTFRIRVSDDRLNVQNKLLALIQSFAVRIIYHDRPAVAHIVRLLSQYLSVISDDAWTTWASWFWVMNVVKDERQQFVVRKPFFQSRWPKAHHPSTVSLNVYIAYAFPFALDSIRTDVHPPRRQLVRT